MLRRSVSARGLKAYVDHDRPRGRGVVHEQERPWSCGPAALVIAARILGIDVDEATLRTAANANPAYGTDEFGIVHAARLLGLRSTILSDVDGSRAWEALCDAGRAGLPVIICVDRWEHWVVVINAVSAGATTIDPADGLSRAVPRDDLLARWREPSSGRPYFGITVGS